MSHEVNSQLIARAAELLEEIDSHPSGLDKVLAKAVESGNLDEVYRLVTLIEAELAMEHFFQYDLLVF